MVDAQPLWVIDAMSFAAETRVTVFECRCIHSSSLLDCRLALVPCGSCLEHSTA
jgi:hypothetical protein